MGAKLALVMFVLMCAMGGGAYWYYNDTQEKIKILTQNNYVNAYMKIYVNIYIYINVNIYSLYMFFLKNS